MRFLISAIIYLGMMMPAWADEKDPLNYPLRHLLVVLGMTMLGGFAGWYKKVRKGEIAGTSIFALIGEMAVSSLAGMGAFLICSYMSVPYTLAAAISGLSGYMGGRTIEIAEKAFKRRAERFFDVEDSRK